MLQALGESEPGQGGGHVEGHPPGRGLAMPRSSSVRLRSGLGPGAGAGGWEPRSGPALSGAALALGELEEEEGGGGLTSEFAHLEL